MKKLEYTFKTDTLFKMLFVKYPDLLQRLVAELLGLKHDSIEQFVITNAEMPPENLGDKFCRLDINMVVDGQRVDLEIQVNNEGDYPERSLYYWAREFSTALSEGQNYIELPRTIVINIIAFKLFDCEDFHSEFRALEVTRHTQLTDKMSLHYYELPKLPTAIDAGNERELWLRLFKADTEEELSIIEALEVPIMSEAVNAYRRVVTSSELKEIERLRSKARHDEAQALYNAERRGREQGIEEGKAKGIEKMIILALQNNFADEAVEAMQKEAGITDARLAELKEQAK